MKIIINALSVFSGGGLTSMLNLLPALERVDREDEYVVVVSARQAAVLGGIPKRFRAHTVRFNPRNLVFRLLYEQIVLPFTLRRLAADWLYSVGNVTSVLAPCRILLLIENANPFSALDVQWSKKERARQVALRILGAWSDRRATVIRFLTARSRDIICGIRGIPINKCVVIPHGVALQESTEEKATGRNLPEQFILSVSNIGPHKNLHTLVDAFKRLVETHGYKGSLVIAGANLYPEYYESLRSRILSAKLESRVLFLDWVDPEGLPSLYKRAEVFVFPSAEETFGIPVIEAMGFGVPVVVPAAGGASDRYFIPYEEICRSAAEYFDAFDSKSLCESIQLVLTDKERRLEMVLAGRQRAAKYRWDDVASGMVGVFQGLKAEG